MILKPIPKLTSIDVTIDSIVLPAISLAESPIGGQEKVGKLEFEQRISSLSKEINALRGRVVNMLIERQKKVEQQRSK